MKKLLILAAIAALSFVTACSKEEEQIDDVTSATRQKVTISATLTDPTTKVEYSANGTGLSLVWDDEDKLLVVNHDSPGTDAQYFTIDTETVGTKTARFSGVLPAGATSYDVSVVHATSDYSAQIQLQDDDMEHLEYVASAINVTDISNVTLDELSGILGITALLPESVTGTVTSVEITAYDKTDPAMGTPSNIFFGGNTLTVTLDSQTDVESDNILKLYATIPGRNDVFNNTSLVIKFNTNVATHSVYTRYVELKDNLTLDAGKFHTLKINCSNTDKHAGKADADGTSAEKAYLVGDKYQMKAMRSLMPLNAKTYFKMVADIDLDNEAWTALNYDENFKREIDFDGQNHVISKLSASGTYASFTGVLYGTLKNVIFDNATISGSSKKGVVAGFLGTTGIPAICENVIVRNSTVSGSGYSGGFAGHVRTIKSVTGCSVINTTVSTTNGHVGGFAAYTDITGDDKYEVPTRFIDCHVVDVTVSQEYASATSNLSTGGFLGGANTGNEFTGCTVKATVTANKAAIRDVGGFVGKVSYACPTFRDCHVLEGSSVEGKGGHVAGFAGYSLVAASYTGCSSAAIVKNESEYTGGFVGYSDGASSYVNCYASGNVSTYKHGGGFVGLAENSSFTDCYYTGGTVTEKASGKSQSGGFCGYTTFGTSFRGCYVKNATFTSTSGTYVGGFVGQLGYTYNGSNNILLTQCHVEGTTVTGSTNCGGFVGVQYDNISSSYVSGGSVTARNAHCGGFSGFVQNANLTNCYSTTTVNGGSYAQIGGMAGIVYTSDISYCYASGSVSGTGADVGAFVGQFAVQGSGAPATASNCIAWTSGSLPFAANNTVGATVTNCYTGNTGSVSAQATALGWPTAYWDLNNAAPVLLATPNRIKAIFIGDSITWQWATIDRSIAQSSLLIPIDPLPSYMTVSGSNVIVDFHPGFFTGNGYLDKGVSGQNTTQMLTRFQKDIVALNPQVVVIMGGTNDLAQGVSKEDIVSNISAMAQMASEAGIKVILCTVTPCNESYSRLSNPKTKGAHIITLNGMLQDVATANGYTWCDYWSALVADDGLALHPNYCLYDRLHPGPDGYDVMEPIVKSLIDGLI